jgi:hypothetical protein
MEIKKTLTEDTSRDIFWARIEFIVDSQKKSTVLAFASHEYLEEHYKTQETEIEKANHWIKEVIEKWGKIEDKLFSQSIHYDIYATSPEGYENGFKFLQTQT